MDDKEENKSFVFVQFAGIGSVLLDVKFENVTALQLLALASFLEVKGKNQLLLEQHEREEREREMALAVPQSKILVGNR